MDSATHWLQRCADDSECGPLSCRCGICTLECDRDGDCELGGVCAQADEGALGQACALGPESAGAAALCVQPCDASGCDTGLMCVEDLCLRDDLASQPAPLGDASAEAGDGLDGSPSSEAGGADAAGDATSDAPGDGAVEGGDAGDGGAPSPVRQAVLHVALGTDFSCAQAADQQVYCWGRNDQGQLGLGDTQPRGDEPAEVGPGLSGFDLGMDSLVQLAAGGAHSCALDTQGRVKCWGANGSGQLGLGDVDNRGDEGGEMDALPFVDLGSGVQAVELALGRNHSCARVVPGPALKCWGDNSAGQLGLGDTQPRGVSAGDMGDALPAVQLGTGRTPAVISAMAFGTCAVLDDDSLRCWGMNTLGQLGLGDAVTRGDDGGEMGDALPEVDTGASGYFRLSAGDDHVCVVYSDFSVRCFGVNASGQLGLGDAATRGDEVADMGVALPALGLPAGVLAATPVAGRSHTCVGFDDQRVRCWGSGVFGQTGLGSPDDFGSSPGETPAALAGVPTATGKQLAEAYSGAVHVCLRYQDGALHCFGRNAEGQLGVGDAHNRGDDPGELGDALPFVFEP